MAGEAASFVPNQQGNWGSVNKVQKSLLVRVAGSLETEGPCLSVCVSLKSAGRAGQGAALLSPGERMSLGKEKKGPVPALRHVSGRKERTHHGLCEVLNVDLCVYHSSCTWLEEADPGVFISRVSARVCNASPNPFWPGPSRSGCPGLLPVALPVPRTCMSMPSRHQDSGSLRVLLPA